MSPEIDNSADAPPAHAAQTSAEPVAAAPAPAVETPAAPAPAPAAPAEAHGASAEDTRHSKAWRSDEVVASLAPKLDEPERPTREQSAPKAEKKERPQAPPPTTDDFAALLGDTPLALPQLEVGDKVNATIVEIGSNSIFVEIGGKTEGAIDRAEYTDDDGALTVGMGDTISAWVVSMRDGIHLSRSLGRGSDNAQALEDAAAQGIPVEGKVTGTNKGGFEVTVLGARAFCPHSQISLDPTTLPEEHLGANYTFLVTRVEEGGRNVVVSRRAFLERERNEQAAGTLERLEVGAVFEGTVTRVAEFGAFVDIGGIDGLVHVSEMSWGRTESPEEIVRLGERVRVSVVSLRDLDNTKERRIGLSMKALQEDPWVSGVRNLHAGDTVQGEVVRLEAFGAFVEIAPGLDGLVHVSELGASRRVHHAREVLQVGQKVQAQIIQIDPSRRQIGLSLKALAPNPWTDAVQSLPVGSTVQGIVDSIQSFGIFVSLPSGLTGLLPISHLSEDEARNVSNRFRAGMAVEARVLAVDPQRERLTLTRRDDVEADQAEAFRSYQQTAAPAQGLGTFADLFKKRG